MTREERIIANTRRWLTHARDDPILAEDAAGKGRSPFLQDALFHCQQAAEKAFKAFLTWHDIAFRKIHDLEMIGQDCLAQDPTLGAVVDQAVRLTQYAWRFRYPGAPYNPTPEEASDALSVAHQAVEAIRSRLPDKARP